MTVLAWLFFVAAAALEVGGDAVIRKGLWGNELTLVGVGAVMLSFYGIAVNMVRWDFSKLLGVYVAVFATVAVLYGRFIFKENIHPSTWLGLAVIILGGLIIQFGPGLKL
jgi:small multidrug resistance family-3 protein